MKTSVNRITTILNICVLLTILLFTQACKQKNQIEEEQDPKEAAEEKNEKTFETKADEKDARFLVNEADNNLKEIKLAQLALTRFSIYEVKDLASMMLADHTKFMEELKDLALRKEIAVPAELTKEAEDECKKLKEKGGREFDLAYCDMMISEHENAITKFEKASKECADTEIKTWAANTLATLRNHLEFSIACKKKIEKVNKI